MSVKLERLPPRVRTELPRSMRPRQYNLGIRYLGISKKNGLRILKTTHGFIYLPKYVMVQNQSRKKKTPGVEFRYDEGINGFLDRTYSLSVLPGDNPLDVYRQFIRRLYSENIELWDRQKVYSQDIALLELMYPLEETPSESLRGGVIP